MSYTTIEELEKLSEIDPELEEVCRLVTVHVVPGRH